MTHGCLLIRVGGRRILLHTSHSGQDIPHLPATVFDIAAERCRKMLGWTKMLRWTPPTQRDVRDVASSLHALREAHNIASLFMAAQPFLLAPVTAGVRKDLPAWALEDPYVLTAKGDLWKLRSDEGESIGQWNVVDEIVNRVTQGAPP